MTHHDTWIAHRELTHADGHPALHVFLGAPRREDDGRWVSVARFDWTSGTKESVNAHGVDAFQALVNALQCIQKLAKDHKLSWLVERGSAGFPAMIPLSFGQGWSDAMELHVEQEASREVARMQLAAEAKS